MLVYKIVLAQSCACKEQQKIKKKITFQVHNHLDNRINYNIWQDFVSASFWPNLGLDSVVLVCKAILAQSCACKENNHSSLDMKTRHLQPEPHGPQSFNRVTSYKSLLQNQKEKFGLGLWRQLKQLWKSSVNLSKIRRLFKAVIQFYHCKSKETFYIAIATKVLMLWK